MGKGSGAGDNRLAGRGIVCAGFLSFYVLSFLLEGSKLERTICVCVWCVFQGSCIGGKKWGVGICMCVF